MRRKPQSIKVAPFTYDVRWDNAAMNAAGGQGQTLADSLLIYADPNIPLGNRQDTLVHEALHAIWAQSNLVVDYPDGSDDSPGERIIRALATRILALIRDNPELVKYLQATEASS